jgi:hypothetical protein
VVRVEDIVHDPKIEDENKVLNWHGRCTIFA